MPTNLPPEAQEAERRYREAKTTEEKIARLEEFIALIPKHKGTEHLVGDLRRKLSKLRTSPQGAKVVSRRDAAYRIEREGAGQVAVVGTTNVGKSALVRALTNAEPEVSDAPFTTWAPTPGMMPVENVQIQLIDTPPLSAEFVEPALMDLLRRVDLILLVVDVRTDPLQHLEEAVALLEQSRIVPLHRKDRYPEDRRWTFKPFLVLANKTDSAEWDEVYDIFRELLDEDWPVMPVSAETGRNLERLKHEVFQRLGVIRIYAKPPGKDPDFSAPFVIKKGSTVEDFAAAVHQDFLRDLKAARVWGSAQFDGQMVPRDYILQDGDVVELRV
ncbi:MAG: TGS domain-containing protein [Anaerolineae bacterium]|nr:TGS domain-containing protein [Anaerolineae bacterium]